MTKPLVYLLAFTFIFCSRNQALALRTCNAHFYQLKQSAEHEGVHYTQIPDRAVLQAELLPPGAIAVGIYDFGHTTLFLDGYRIDGYGSAGIEVRSHLKKDKWIRRDVLFVINNPPQELLENLRAEIEDFKSKSRINCVSLTCHYLMNVEGGEGVLSETTFWPLKLIDMLVELSQNNPDFEIDIYTLDDRSMGSIRAGMRRNSIVVPTALGLGASVILSVFTAAALTFIY